jgi:excisionase family DNA binding protein
MKPPTATSPWEAQSVADAMRRTLEIYTPKELARRLGISKRAVLKAIKAGSLKANKVNSRVYQIESPAAARWWVGLSL